MESIRGNVQSAYSVLVASSEALLAQNRVEAWDSGKVDSCRSTYVLHGGEPLGSEATYYWTVRVWNADGEASEYSEPATFTTALPDTAGLEDSVKSTLLGDESDYWRGQWIGIEPDQQTNQGSLPEIRQDNGVQTTNEVSPLLCNEVYLNKEIEQARMHVITLGYGDLYINGTRVGDEQLGP